MKDDDARDLMSSKKCLDQLLDSNLVNRNFTKESMMRQLNDMESEAKQKARERSKVLFGKNPKFRVPQGLHQWERSQQKSELKKTKVIFYGVQNLNLFLRQVYDAKESGQSEHRKATYCERCLQIFYSNSIDKKNHEESCRSKGIAGRYEIFEEVSPKVVFVSTELSHCISEN